MLFISDVDECQDKTLCSAANEECLNDQGIFYCLCRSGYRREDKVCVKEGERSKLIINN